MTNFEFDKEYIRQHLQMQDDFVLHLNVDK